ncbi:hypothetical protein BJY04DRAFT_6995 [Aspergillus karnatakaensis]|uniref:uncharacterized protein n=1 Tax=Aspergillus karnatakaensis TaxID=1810916 RepID=UPI003CCE3798
MKLSLVALTSLLALVVAQEESSTTSDAPATTPSLTPQERCLVACEPADRCCRAQCIGVPCPSEQQANDTNSCVAACDQGDGSEADTQAYAQCQARCITTTFFPGTVTVTDAPSSTSTDTEATATDDSDDSNNDDSNSDDSSNDDSNNDSNNDDSNNNDSNSDDSNASESDSANPSETDSAENPEDTDNAAAKLGFSAAGLATFLVAALAL